jgi:hypothetical protein
LETVIIFNNQCYLTKNNLDVFFLRDNFKTTLLVEALLRHAEKISVSDITGRKMYKFENFKWYFWEHDFLCWECAEDYRPCPELAPEIQREFMMGLNA